MNILVMGGTTFVSKCFAMYAIEKGYTVDIFTRGKRKLDYEGVNQHLIGDRKNIEDLKRLITKPYDYVVDVSAYYEEDVQKLCQVLDTSKLKRYVFCSTMSVYMQPKEGELLKEDSPRGFDEFFGGAYGENKAKAEDYLMEQDIPVTIFRPAYIYGEYNNIFRDGYLFESIERGKINVLEDKYSVQFVYIWDLVKSFESCFHNDKSINQAYNVTNPTRINWSEWVEMGFYATGKKCEVEVYTEDMIEESDKEVFPFESGEIYGSVEKLKRDGLFVPNTDMREGLKNAYEWYKNNGQDTINRGIFDIA